jgi:transposase
MLPSVHFLDAGYVSVDLLVTAERVLGVPVCGPVKKDVRRQVNNGQGFGRANFRIDWAAQTVTWPNGQTTSVWYEYDRAHGKPVILVKFKPSVCHACANQAKCTNSASGARLLKLQRQAQHEALRQMRRRQESAAFRRLYAKRSGIEGTNSQAVRACDMRPAPYRGLSSTHLQMIATVVAVNLHHTFDRWTGVPHSPTRVSPFAHLAPEMALVSTCWRA